MTSAERMTGRHFVLDLIQSSTLKHGRRLVDLPRLRLASSIMVALFFVATFFLPVAARAQHPNLMIETSSIQPSVVVGRPMLTWWDVKLDGVNLATGRFQFKIKHGFELLATFETEEMTLNGPEQRIRVLLPAIESLRPIDQLIVQISFQGKTISGNLGEQILRCPFMMKKVFVSLVAESKLVTKQSSQRESLLGHLKLESLIDQSTTSVPKSEDQSFVKTILASIDPADFPTESLTYCSYDMVIVLGDEFRSLRKPQLEGLLAWVKAGGSLYVEPDGILEPYHLEFVRGLLDHNSRSTSLIQDPSGRLLLPPELEQSPLLLQDCGVGIVAIGFGGSSITPQISSERMAAVSRSLWRVRLHPVRRENMASYLVGPDGKPLGVDVKNPDPYGLSIQYSLAQRMAHQNLLDRLMPEDVRLMSVTLLGAILLLLIILIGPVDYLFLGWLRLRKFTWVTFPVATVVMTAMTVKLFNYYLTSTTGSHSAIVHDVGPGGDIVRSNRFEIHFLAEAQVVATDVEKGLFAGLKIHEMAPQYRFNAQGQAIAMLRQPIGNRPATDRFGQVAAQSTTLSGRIPSGYQVSQAIGKWTPQMNRILTIPAAGESTNIDWKQFQLAKSDQESIVRRVLPPKLVEAVRNQFGSTAMVACFTGEHGWAYQQSAGWKSRADFVSLKPTPVPVLPPDRESNLVSRGDQAEAPFFQWIYQVSVNMPDLGLHSVLKQRSPTGNTASEDLPLLDSSDSNAWLLVIIVPTADLFTIYRVPMRFMNADHASR